MKLRYFLPCLLIFAFLFLSAHNIRDFGSPTHSEMDTYFLRNAQEQTGANNVVSAVLFDYRGLDTLGEATVLFTAISGVLIISKTILEDDNVDVKNC